MPMDWKNNPLTFFICTSQSVSKERKSFLHTVCGKCSGVPQRSILGPPLFNIYICDMFFETSKNIDFAEYADDNTPYTCSSNTEEVLENLQGALEQLFQWFSANHLVANEGKCHLLTSFKIRKNVAISNTSVSSEQKVKLLGINLQSRMNFDYHVNILLNKANKNCHALARVCNYMNTNKRRVLMKAFITHFSFLTVHLYGCLIAEL